MTVYSITPIPTQGGTITLNTSSTTWTSIGNNKFMVIYHQTVSDYIVAHIVTYNGISNPPTVGQMFQIRAAFSGCFRAFKVSDTKVVIFYVGTTTGISVQFVSFDASDNIVPSAVSSTLLSVYANIKLETYYDFSIEQTSDTTFLASWLENSPKSLYLTTYVVIDPVAETFTKTRKFTYDSLANSMSARVLPIRNSNCAFSAALYTNTSDVYRYHFSMVDSSGTYTIKYLASVGSSSWPASTVLNYTPISTNDLVYVASGSSTTITHLTWTPDSNVNVIVSSMSLTGSYIAIIPMDEYHFMVVGLSATEIRVKMIQRHSNGIFLCSPATNVTGGLKLNLGSITSGMTHVDVAQGNYYMKQPCWSKIDDATYLIWFFWNNTLCYKVIYR